MANKILIKNGLLVDPANKINGIFDILITNKKITKVSKNIAHKDAEIIDAKGKIVTPGLIDMHVHAREPGQTQKETIKTAARAAARGGVATCVLMPNTTPATDNVKIVNYIKKKIKKDAIVNMLPSGAIGKNLGSEKLSPLVELKKAGVMAYTNDGHPVSRSDVMLEALKLCKKLNLPILSHSEDLELSGGGCMNEGAVSKKLRLPGIPAASEYVQVAKEIMLAKAANARLHFMHISTAESLDLIRWGKSQGIKITCETAPHYFSVTDRAVFTRKAYAKVNPPIKSKKDLLAVISGLADNTIDCIATDHAPHTKKDKTGPFQNCANGFTGLELMVGLIFTNLIHPKKIKLEQAIAKLTNNPAKILGLKNKGHLSVGADADITIIDSNLTEKIKKEDFESKGSNTPFAGTKLKGLPIFTIVGGNIVMKNRQIIN